MPTYDTVRRAFRLRALFNKYGDAAEYALARLEAGKPYHWDKAFSNIWARCSNPAARGFRYYGGRGILCLLEPRDLLRAFVRDRGWDLQEPSVDRIDSRGHYTPDNIRWIEMAQNRRRRKIGLDKMRESW